MSGRMSSFSSKNTSKASTLKKSKQSVGKVEKGKVVPFVVMDWVFAGGAGGAARGGGGGGGGNDMPAMGRAGACARWSLLLLLLL